MAFSPIVTSPITLAPAPTTTLSFSVGWRLARRVLVPPSVTPWKRCTLSPMIAVSPMTTPMPWSMKNPSPISAPGWISMPVKKRADVREQPRRHFEAVVVQGVREAVHLPGVEARIGEHDFEVVDGGRIALARRLDVALDAI